jgi:hypothetical protein
MYVLTLINFKRKTTTRFYFIKKHFFSKKYKIVNDFNNEICDIILKKFIFNKIKKHKYHIFNKQLLISILNNKYDKNKYSYFSYSYFNIIESVTY